MVNYGKTNYAGLVYALNNFNLFKICKLANWSDFKVWSHLQIPGMSRDKLHRFVHVNMREFKILMLMTNRLANCVPFYLTEHTVSLSTVSGYRFLCSALQGHLVDPHCALVSLWFLTWNMLT